MIFESFKGGARRYDIEVDGIMFAADVSKKYRNGWYVNIRLNPKGDCWGSRNYMFSGERDYPLVISKVTIAAFFIENNGNARPVSPDKEKVRNKSDKSKIDTDWRPYALALSKRLGNL